MINEGLTIKDKLAIIRYFITGNKKLVRQVTIKNKDGIFYCGNNMGNVWVASSFHEPYLQEYFNIQNGVFVDIGANIGKYTIKIANQLSRERDKVVSIEAEEENSQKIEESIKLNNLKNVILENVACYSKNGKIKLYLDEIPGHHTIIKSDYRKSKRSITVKAKKLDTILKENKINKVDFIKIDVEGAEVEVLKGAKKTLSQIPRPRIIFEAWDEKYLNKTKKILKVYEYEIRKITDTHYFAC